MTIRSNLDFECFADWLALFSSKLQVSPETADQIESQNPFTARKNYIGSKDGRAKGYVPPRPETPR